MPSNYESKFGSKNLDDLVNYLVKSSAKQPAVAQKDQEE
jgi:hypothetical protein